MQPLESCAKNLNRQLVKVETKMYNKCMKMHSILLINKYERKWDTILIYKICK